MNKSTHETEIEIAGVEYPAEVDFVYYPGYKGARERGGLQLEPDEQESVEILAIRVHDGGEYVALPSLEEVEAEMAHEILDDIRAPDFDD